MGYYGKKIDPEPGRCRRTDGKKWRCSKDAHPESKYCERHMNRSRYRSRKPVESQNGTTAAQNPIANSTYLSRSPYCITNKDYRYIILLLLLFQICLMSLFFCNIYFCFRLTLFYWCVRFINSSIR